MKKAILREPEPTGTGATERGIAFMSRAAYSRKIPVLWRAPRDPAEPRPLVVTNLQSVIGTVRYGRRSESSALWHCENWPNAAGRSGRAEHPHVGLGIRH